jgi:hypothetical protein
METHNGTKSPSLATLRAQAEALYVQDNQAFGRYVATDTESVEVPSDMWDAPMSTYISFHPAFGLADLRRQRWERIHALRMAAVDRAKEQPCLPGLEAF